MSRLVLGASGALLPPEGAPAAPVRGGAASLDVATVRQLRAIARQPWVVGHVAAMADAHVASGVAVGTVFATEHAVVPAALGGDLGCGMAAVRLGPGTREALRDRRALERLLARLASAIPVGDAVHRSGGRGAIDEALLAPSLSTHALERTREALLPRHLATLGGGNHFLELDRDAEGELWLLVHSGSRGLGAAVAAHHARVASSREGALVALDARRAEGSAYLADQGWALAVARANRRALVARALEVLADDLPALAADEVVDVHHNFVARERWLARDVLVHRKGAISVPEGAKALVPGSMGTASYLVEGLGNPLAFGSCSHGAGRVMSRTEARARITPRAHEAAVRHVVVHGGSGRALLEESPAAYRDVVEVLRAQEDLVRRLVRLEPVAVLKG